MFCRFDLEKGKREENPLKFTLLFYSKLQYPDLFIHIQWQERPQQNTKFFTQQSYSERKNKIKNTRLFVHNSVGRKSRDVHNEEIHEAFDATKLASLVVLEIQRFSKH